MFRIKVYRLGKPAGELGAYATRRQAEADLNAMRALGLSAGTQMVVVEEKARANRKAPSRRRKVSHAPKRISARRRDARAPRRGDLVVTQDRHYYRIHYYGTSRSKYAVWDDLANRLVFGPSTLRQAQAWLAAKGVREIVANRRRKAAPRRHRR